MRKELKTVLRGGAAVLCAGGMYYLLCRFTPFSIPCIFLTLFGIYCPGCGITRMMMYILELDFPAAAASNPFLFVSLPFLAVFFAAALIQYLKTGRAYTARWQKVCLYIYVGLLIIYGLLRNIPAFSFLAPH